MIWNPVCWFNPHAYVTGPSRYHGMETQTCSRCGDTHTRQTTEELNRLQKLWAEEDYKRKHLQEFGVRVIWQSGNSRISLVPLFFLKEYLQITDAWVAKQFSVEPRGDDILVTSIFSSSQ